MSTCPMTCQLARRSAQTSEFVIAGLDPAIHDDVRKIKTGRFIPPTGFMDGRVKPGHDEL